MILEVNSSASRIDNLQYEVTFINFGQQYPISIYVYLFSTRNILNLTSALICYILLAEPSSSQYNVQITKLNCYFNNDSFEMGNCTLKNINRTTQSVSYSAILHPNVTLYSIWVSYFALTAIMSDVGVFVRFSD